MAFNLRKPPRLRAKRDAYPYQLDAVRTIRSLPYAAIFHEQGLGKTKIAIDLILLWLEEDVVDTVFVVTKKSLVQNWIDELSFHTYVVPKILSGNRKPNSIALNSPVLIYVLNYEVVQGNFDLIQHFLHTCRVGVVLDESQKIKNPEARLSVSFHSLHKKFARRIIMTGTPVANRPYDIWSQIKFLDGGKSLGASFEEFKSTVDLPSGSDSVSEYGSHLTNIMNRIKDFAIRETKCTAGLELPDKTILTHFAQMAPRQAAIYASYRDEMAYSCQDPTKSSIADQAEDILKRLLRLVQCASNPGLVDLDYNEIPGKYAKLVELLEIIKIRSYKAIIWTAFIENVEWLSLRMKSLKPQKVHGRMSIFDRNQSIRKFKTDAESRVLVATPGAAKEGLTLTVANHAIFFDRGFALDDYLQAQDRIHRISQNKECFVHNIIVRDTIDEWVDVLLNAKYQAAQLAQGDITREEFNTEFRRDLPDILPQILSPDRNQIRQEERP